MPYASEVAASGRFKHRSEYPKRVAAFLENTVVIAPYATSGLPDHMPNVPFAVPKPKVSKAL